jgi:hypothetical protein
MSKYAPPQIYGTLEDNYDEPGFWKKIFGGL